MSALILTAECGGGPDEILGIPVEPAPPQHDRCPGSHTTPGLLGGWHCSCNCHAEQRAAGAVSGLQLRAICHCGWESDALFDSEDAVNAAIEAHRDAEGGDGWEIRSEDQVVKADQ